MVLSSVALLNVIYSYIFRWMWHVLPPTRHYASWNLIWSDIVFHNVPSAQFGCQTKIPSYSKHIWRTRFSASHQHVQGMYVDMLIPKKLLLLDLQKYSKIIYILYILYIYFKFKTCIYIYIYFYKFKMLGLYTSV